MPLLWQPYKQLPNLALPEQFDSAPRINLDCQLDHDGDHYYHAFVVLDIDGEQGVARYCQVPGVEGDAQIIYCLLYTSPSPRDKRQSRMPSSA